MVWREEKSNMTKMTSAQAAKELRKLNDQHDALLARENKSREFVAAIQEDVEKIRPEYDYAGIQDELDRMERRIRALKHAINTFNLFQEVPGFGMTIDQMLVYIPQLTARKKKLDYMRKKLPREKPKMKARNGIPNTLRDANSTPRNMPMMKETSSLTI